MIDVSIIIVNYNTCKLTSECIDSIIDKTTGLTYEVILVDNASTDGSRVLFEKDTRISYIYNPENIGFGRANNLGISIAQGRNIFFLNSDTLLINNAVKILSDYLDTHAQIGAVGGNLYTKTYHPMHSFQRLTPSLLNEINECSGKILSKLFFGKNIEHNFTQSPLSVAYITGADLMIRKEILTSIGGFNPIFFMYYEETELSYRIKKAHYKIYSVPSAKIIHLEGGSFTPEQKVTRFIMSRNSLYTYIKLTRPWQVLPIRFLWKCRCLIHIIICTLNNKEKHILKFWKALYTNTKI